MTTMGQPLVGEPAPMPEPAPTLVLPGYLHKAFSLRTHTRPMPNISMETKYHRQTYPSRHITCSIQLTYRPLPPPPRGDNVSWTTLQPPCTPSQPQPGPWQPQPPDMHPRSTHPASTIH